MTKRRNVRWWLALAVALILLLGLGGSLFAQAENLPAKPDRYITDKAGVLDVWTVTTINNQLEQFEKETSNQIVVAIYPSLPQDAEIAQYATDTYNAWGIGQKGKDNGALLMIFVNDHKMFIATGRGLEGALPDAICKNIITQVVAPQFKQGNYAGGIQSGINAMIAAAKGEYKGTGTTVAERNGSGNLPPAWIIVFFIILIILSAIFRGRSYQAGPFIFTSGGYGGGGYSGGGGFSGGGGSSAGGGAGGGW